METKLQSTIDDRLLLDGGVPDKLKVEICDAFVSDLGECALTMSTGTSNADEPELSY